MIYPKIGEWVHVPELGKEITALPAAMGLCTTRIHHGVFCVFRSEHGMLLPGCANSGECIRQGSVIYVDRERWALARLTK